MKTNTNVIENAAEPCSNSTALLEDLLSCMVDMTENATDTYWVSSGETLWERMASIYEEHGGNMKALEAKFPQCF